MYEACEKYGIPRDAIITIAGTVGVGKSTLTKKLAETLDFRTSFEKVDGNPYLEKYYQDFNRWSFHLQIYFLAERFKEQKRMFQYGGGFIQDRSIYEDTAIFAQMNYDNGSMSKEDFDTYNSLFNAMVMTPYFPHSNLIIYLEGDIDEIVGRIGTRGRQMEIDTPVEYWYNLHRRYEDWIENFTSAPVLRLNINEYDLVNDEKSIDYILAKIGRVLNTKS
ncbi:deoxynucleoside kinase [Turicibacter sanguinis]|jgi:deoxynucleoside kinase|uniref:deoxynucleoside kinase n=1 Tax=Turicibacter sanguinis TaxID=154288 RepID=UPI0012BB4E6F|nr:deoxynucleoside kinase [Turicibacter sanguinis]MDB8555754.1 deoxynucleoside kinase [Turicibacter sanguinis]MDB8559088.1 deoxynucleoside kinase [Turicibacter sanguinis]MDB8561884.1 deoxynucleoside kinase [Turicibacter sanguinis]MTN82408.1 deoxynucleoside kinase [Turicibacter sanguinis]MTN85315.1 deoxynucleoside kinase [Turicibacter sanguinis]